MSKLFSFKLKRPKEGYTGEATLGRNVTNIQVHGTPVSERPDSCTALLEAGFCFTLSKEKSSCL